VHVITRRDPQQQHVEPAADTYLADGAMTATRPASRLMRASQSGPLAERMAMSRLSEASVARPLP